MTAVWGDEVVRHLRECTEILHEANEGAMNHTPGPWVVERGSSLLMVVAEKGGMPGLIVNQGPIEPRDRANARLIAAAPDLLAALQSLLAAVEADVRVKRGDYYRERKIARAAIAKAEGK